MLSPQVQLCEVGAATISIVQRSKQIEEGEVTCSGSELERV